VHRETRKNGQSGPDECSPAPDLGQMQPQLADFGLNSSFQRSEAHVLSQQWISLGSRLLSGRVVFLGLSSLVAGACGVNTIVTLPLRSEVPDLALDLIAHLLGHCSIGPFHS
jgi:hypothetical protein